MRYAWLALLIGVLAVASPVMAEDRYAELGFIDSGSIDIYTDKDQTTNYIYIVGEDKGLTIRYPVGQTAPKLTTESWGIRVTAAEGHSLIDGECRVNEHIYCGNVPGESISCNCIPEGTWCDTDDEIDVSSNLAFKNAGC